MLKYYFLIAFRHFVKNKSFAIINLIGLTLGIVSCVLILQYVFFEQSYDSFHEKKDRTYRITSSRYTDGVKQYDKAKAFIPLGKTLTDEFPEVESYVTMFPMFSETDVFISYEKEGDEAKVFREKDVFHVRGNISEVFDFQMLQGNTSLVSPEPNTVYISASMARKYFGEEDPIGKVLGYNQYGDYKVAGVFADMPANSHIHFNFIFPWETLTPYDDTHWRWDGFLTYIVLAPEADPAAFSHKLATFSEKKNEEESYGKLQYSFHLQPIEDIHLHSNLVGEVEPNGNAEIFYILLALALLVLLIAWVNYVNLSTAKLLDRGKEVAVRKIMGSHQKHLVLQLLIESFLLNGIASLIALLIITLAIPYYSEFTGMPLEYEMFQNASFWFPFFMIFFGGCLSVGIIPALMYSSFEPIKMLKGKLSSGVNTFPAYMRSGLVVFQLIVSLSLIMGSLVAYQQINYMNKLDAKLDKDNVIVVRTLELPSPPGTDTLFVRKIGALKNSLNTHPFILGASLGSGVPGLENQLKASWFRRSLEDENNLTMEVNRVDYDFMQIFKPEIIAGRNFSKELQSDKKACVINKEALKQLGFSNAEEALNKGLIVGSDNEKKEILGVIDFQTMASKYRAAPEIFLMDFGPAHYLSVKVSGESQQNISTILEKIQASWASVFPDRPFDFFFLNDFFASQYQVEQKLKQSIFLFASLSIILACLGIYGLTSFTYIRRTKELGVRKILGSSVQQIVRLLLKSYVKLLTLAGLLFPPLIYYVLNKWLENYQSRIEIEWWHYAVSYGFMLIIPVLCIAYQTVKTALLNPVNLLRDE